MIFQGQFFSQALQSETLVNVIVPQNATNTTIKYPVLYLLHGVLGGPSSWLRYTNLEKYAEDYRLVIVMPDGANSFYLDAPNLPQYKTFIASELPAIVKNCFSVSQKSSETFIAGLSMGGYGALRLALEYPEQYSCAASLSGVLDIELLLKSKNPQLENGILSTLKAVPIKQANLFDIVKEQANESSKQLSVFISCGTEDFAYPHFLSAKQALTPFFKDIVFESHKGEHNWEYWDTHIVRVLNWLPIQKIYN